MKKDKRNEEEYINEIEEKIIELSFKLKNNVILMSIEDDGDGFNVNKARKGIGLKNIDSRVSEIGGIAKVFSEINKGTKFEISIPTVNK